MIRDLMQRATGRSLQLNAAANVKYLQLIIPGMVPEASIGWTSTEGSYQVTAVLKDKEVVLFKMTARYDIQEQ
jgi:hypothetical protein